MERITSNKQFGNTDPAPKLEFKKWKGWRGTNPTCMHFGVGPNRLILHPSGYFCNTCEWYENQVVSGGKRINLVAKCMLVKQASMIGCTHMKSG